MIITNWPTDCTSCLPGRLAERLVSWLAERLDGLLTNQLTQTDLPTDSLHTYLIKFNKDILQ